MLTKRHPAATRPATRREPARWLDWTAVSDFFFALTPDWVLKAVEAGGFARLVKDIRAVERSVGSPEKQVLDTEVPVMEKLRRVGK